MIRRNVLAATLCFLCATSSVNAAQRPNILIVTVDDMSADSVGVYDCPLDTTPNIDAFARRALRFRNAHVQVGNCMPGRNLMWSGLFSHVNGVEGFVQNKSPSYPVLCDLAKQAGYFTAIRGKVSHSTPYFPYAWDADVTKAPDGSTYANKDPKTYAESTKRAIELAKRESKPFCLMVNISDPHKPFYSQVKGGGEQKDPYIPSRVFSADEVPVPGFLPVKNKIVRKELALYYSSVRRADDAVGFVLSALEESGEADDTFIMFLSDHGMPLPFAKTQLYYHSTRTPLIVRWPGVTKPDTEDTKHLVSAIDFLPTLLDVMGYSHPNPDSLHGQSFAQLLRGKPQAERTHVLLQYNENSGRNRQPMRGIQERKLLYLYNPWSNGERKFATATTGTATYRQMVERAKSSEHVSSRLQLFNHRVLEELYDVVADPNCLVNLVDREDYRQELDRLRGLLLTELQRTDDPIAPLVADLENSKRREAYMAIEDQRTLKARKERQAKNARKKANLKKNS